MRQENTVAPEKSERQERNLTLPPCKKLNFQRKFFNTTSYKMIYNFV